MALGGNMSRPANAAGFLIHAALHKARPDVNAACHFHSTYGKAWSAFAQPLEMLNQDVTMFYGKAQSVYKEFGGVVLKEEESEALATALGPEGKGMILRNHGLLTVGGTVDEAAYLFLLMEKSCQIQLAADAAAAVGRQKVFIDDEAARYTFESTSESVGSALASYRKLLTSRQESLYAEFQVYLQYEAVVSHDGYKAL
ncbi:class II aldolase/adducin N-terminal [Aspergillus carlsbadensis]|nr:class II aldolase/adducin N-terminal [Aspergillus carlsbadensis]